MTEEQIQVILIIFFGVPVPTIWMINLLKKKLQEMGFLQDNIDFD